jgi:hypothetical protein
MIELAPLAARLGVLLLGATVAPVVAADGRPDGEVRQAPSPRVG